MRELRDFLSFFQAVNGSYRGNAKRHDLNEMLMEWRGISSAIALLIGQSYRVLDCRGAKTARDR